jgi:hypothetical protein
MNSLASYTIDVGNLLYQLSGSFADIESFLNSFFVNFRRFHKVFLLILSVTTAQYLTFGVFCFVRAA